MQLKIASLRLFVRPLVVSGAIVAASLSGAGCSDSGSGRDGAAIPTVPANGAPPGIGAARPGDGPGVDPTPGEGPATGAPPVRQAGAASLAAQVALLHAAQDAENKAVSAGLAAARAAALEGPSPFKTAIAARYAKAGAGLIFAADGALTPAADRFVELVLDSDAHALPAEAMDVAGLQALLKSFATTRIGLETASGGADDGVDKVRTLVASTAGKTEAEIVAAAKAAGLSDADLPRVEALRALVPEVATARKAYNEALVAVDHALVKRLYRYAYEMRFARRAHPFYADRSDAEGIKRTAEALDAWLTPFFGETGVDVEAMNRAAVPAHPDYARTVEAYARYRQLAEKYPKHLELDKDVERLRRGKSGKAVLALATRLQQEGFYEGELDDKFGPALEAAVIAYQGAHQLKESGDLERIMRGSLNKTYAERATQLALSLQRLRESELHQGEWRFGEAPVRGRINIPAFEATFFLDGVEAKRHRVVVGNNQTGTDEKTGKRGKLNQTRMFSAEMATIVLNPTWNVPRRIKEQELDLMLMDEPDYYAKNNFAVKVLSDGTELVVQQPGPGNALGLVKFLFPNEYAIYLHDTPSKKLFGRPVRAFSHGCMRTENPLELARWILVDVTKRLEQDKFDEISDSREQTSLAVRPKIPITTDYVTTGFDPEGRLIFYADVYGFDADYAEGKTPYREDRDHPNTQIF